jgi:hypothetical protein
MREEMVWGRERDCWNRERESGEIVMELYSAVCREISFPCILIITQSIGRYYFHAY